MLPCYKGSCAEWSFETFGSNWLRLLLSDLFCGVEWYLYCGSQQQLAFMPRVSVPPLPVVKTQERTFKSDFGVSCCFVRVCAAS